MELQTISNYVDRRQKDAKRLEKYDHMAQMGDYAMGTCKALKNAKGEKWTFKKLWWVDINRQLDEEEARVVEWQESGEVGERPATKLRDELIRAMHAIDEDDEEQIFFEIRFYRDRNLEMHSGILDLRLAGRYEEVLAIIEKDLRDLRDSLPADQMRHFKKYESTILRFRSSWFEAKTTDENGQLVWKKNKEARRHVASLKKPGDESKKVDELEIISKKINEVKDMVGHLDAKVGDLKTENAALAEQHRQAVTSSLEYYAAGYDTPNPSQKRILSGHGIYSPATKRRRAEETQVAFETMGGMGSEDEENKENKTNAIDCM